MINREALYEKACDLEAQALSHVGKIVNDETRTDEWRIWSAILAERTAFKHDIFDAPEVKPEPQWIPCSERLPEESGQYIVTEQNFGGHNDADIHDVTVHTAYFYADDEEWDELDRCYLVSVSNITAWMSLSEPYRGEG